MSKPKNSRKPIEEVRQNQNHQPRKKEKQPSWLAVRDLFGCRHLQAQQQQQREQKQQKPLPQHRKPDQQQQSKKEKKHSQNQDQTLEETSKKCKKMKCSGSICSNSKVMHRPETASLEFQRKRALMGGSGGKNNISSRSMKGPLNEINGVVSSTISELSPDDTSKNIVEIIFQSSWLKKQAPICKIDRILKVHNTQRTISKFEEYRDYIKAKAIKLPKKQPRCIADGNELLRFHCTTFACSLGLNGASNLCNSGPHCNVCSIIKNGFKEATTRDDNGHGILTTATSGKAHDKAAISEDGGGGGGDKRAMLVCRVIAGRVKKSMEGNAEDYDSVATGMEVYSNLDELYVSNPRAILPCFVVIYRGF
uniref:PARP catalytic domain-containing protein n=1 Tax=Salix viminalis TaxID=40686 RepID=A0A6N2MAG2_SALVM